MTTVYLALGSNVGDSRQEIARAIALLGTKLQRLQTAPLYTSKAVGYTDQPDFVNTAIKADTDMTPRELLTFVKQVEKKVGRVARFRWGPREIDIDIILYGEVIHETPTLTLPHLSFRERDFVLRPLCDLNPEALDPVTNQTVQQLADDLSASQASILRRLP
jgi:2-amino-4-hydroxy-6-hydroxymethyldihydropteridine diphosphokinase